MELHSILNSVGTGIALLSILWLTAVKITRLEVKVETMWGFLMKRAVIEGIDRGLMTVNSPVRLEPHSSEMFVHLADELRGFRAKNSRLGEADLALAIEKQFGDRLVHEVCIPNNISFGVCLLIATAVAKGEHTLTEILDEYRIPQKQPSEN
jgi:hypothetical protein